jgi:Asp-tRNA(Asn)/Glu-tRNA(Gln) amidotransferase B subunit
VQILDAGTISHKQAKEVFVEMFDHKKNPEEVIAAKGLEQSSNTDELTTMMQDLLSKHPKEVAGIKAGNARMQGFFVGQLMKLTGGKANPQLASEILKKLIDAMDGK